MSALFLGGIAPGLALIALFIVYSVIHSKLFDGYQPVERAGWPERIATSWRALPSPLLAGLIIGGIYLGAFTPTEAAAIGFALAILITCVILRTLTWKGFREAMFDAMVTTVAIVLIIACAKVFGQAITLYRVPQDISAAITHHISTAFGLFLLVSLMLLAMGMVFEALSMVLIMTPVLLPSVTSMGLDPVWFGVYMVIMVECALITPPVGLNLYAIQAVTKASLGEVSRGTIPFLVLILVIVFALYLWPGLALYIPFKL